MGFSRDRHRGSNTEQAQNRGEDQLAEQRSGERHGCGLVECSLNEGFISAAWQTPPSAVSRFNFKVAGFARIQVFLRSSEVWRLQLRGAPRATMPARVNFRLSTRGLGLLNFRVES